MRFTIDEYCEQFKMPREAVIFQINTDKLNYIIEDGVTYIIVARSSLHRDTRREIHEKNKARQEPHMSTAKLTINTILALYKQENQLLKDKIQRLEIKIDKLIDDKERMLADERDRVQLFYDTKDKQLKKILELINTKLMLEHQQKNTQEEVINVSLNKTVPLVELRQYLKNLDLSSSQKKIIKKRFLSAKNQDVRIIYQNDKLYLDFAKYDYSDLLKH